MPAFGAILSLHPLFLPLILSPIGRRILACHPTTRPALGPNAADVPDRALLTPNREVAHAVDLAIPPVSTRGSGAVSGCTPLSLYHENRARQAAFSWYVPQERNAMALSATDERSESYACKLRRSLGAEPVAQQLEIADLSLGELVAGVPACSVFSAFDQSLNPRGIPVIFMLWPPPRGRWSLGSRRPEDSTGECTRPRTLPSS
jgi:hypothetical protein